MRPTSETILDPNSRPSEVDAAMRTAVAHLSALPRHPPPVVFLEHRRAGLLPLADSSAPPAAVGTVEPTRKLISEILKTRELCGKWVRLALETAFDGRALNDVEEKNGDDDDDDQQTNARRSKKPTGKPNKTETNYDASASILTTFEVCRGMLTREEARRAREDVVEAFTEMFAAAPAERLREMLEWFCVRLAQADLTLLDVRPHLMALLGAFRDALTLTESSATNRPHAKHARELTLMICEMITPSRDVPPPPHSLISLLHAPDFTLVPDDAFSGTSIREPSLFALYVCLCLSSRASVINCRLLLNVSAEPFFDEAAGPPTSSAIAAAIDLAAWLVERCNAYTTTAASLPNVCLQTTLSRLPSLIESVALSVPPTRPMKSDIATRLAVLFSRLEAVRPHLHADVRNACLLFPKPRLRAVLLFPRSLRSATKVLHNPDLSEDLVSPSFSHIQTLITTLSHEIVEVMEALALSPPTIAQGEAFEALAEFDVDIIFSLLPSLNLSDLKGKPLDDLRASFKACVRPSLSPSVALAAMRAARPSSILRETGGDDDDDATERRVMVEDFQRIVNDALDDCVTQIGTDDAPRIHACEDEAARYWGRSGGRRISAIMRDEYPIPEWLEVSTPEASGPRDARVLRLAEAGLSLFHPELLASPRSRKESETMTPSERNHHDEDDDEEEIEDEDSLDLAHESDDESEEDSDYLLARGELRPLVEAFTESLLESPSSDNESFHTLSRLRASARDSPQHALEWACATAPKALVLCSLRVPVKTTANGEGGGEDETGGASAKQTFKWIIDGIRALETCLTSARPATNHLVFLLPLAKARVDFLWKLEREIEAAVGDVGHERHSFFAKNAAACESWLARARPVLARVSELISNGTSAASFWYASKFASLPTTNDDTSSSLRALVEFLIAREDEGGIRALGAWQDERHARNSGSSSKSWMEAAQAHASGRWSEAGALYRRAVRAGVNECIQGTGHLAEMLGACTRGSFETGVRLGAWGNMRLWATELAALQLRAWEAGGEAEGEALAFSHLSLPALCALQREKPRGVEEETAMRAFLQPRSGRTLDLTERAASRWEVIESAARAVGLSDSSPPTSPPVGDMREEMKWSTNLAAMCEAGGTWRETAREVQTIATAIKAMNKSPKNAAQGAGDDDVVTVLEATPESWSLVSVLARCAGAKVELESAAIAALRALKRGDEQTALVIVDRVSRSMISPESTTQLETTRPWRSVVELAWSRAELRERVRRLISPELQEEMEARYRLGRGEEIRNVPSSCFYALGCYLRSCRRHSDAALALTKCLRRGEGLREEREGARLMLPACLVPWVDEGNGMSHDLGDEEWEANITQLLTKEVPLLEIARSSPHWVSRLDASSKTSSSSAQRVLDRLLSHLIVHAPSSMVWELVARDSRLASRFVIAHPRVWEEAMLLSGALHVASRTWDEVWEEVLEESHRTCDGFLNSWGRPSLPPSFPRRALFPLLGPISLASLETIANEDAATPWNHAFLASEAGASVRQLCELVAAIPDVVTSTFLLETLIPAISQAKSAMNLRVASQPPFRRAADMIGTAAFAAVSSSLTSLHLSRGRETTVMTGEESIARLEPTIEVLRTKTRPRRVWFTMTDGSRRSYLLKRSEDLRADQRAVEISGLGGGGEDESGESYAVIPLRSHLGLVEWIEGAVPLYRIYQEWRERKGRTTLEEETGIDSTKTTEEGGKRKRKSPDPEKLTSSSRQGKKPQRGRVTPPASSTPSRARVELDDIAAFNAALTKYKEAHRAGRKLGDEGGDEEEEEEEARHSAFREMRTRVDDSFLASWMMRRSRDAENWYARACQLATSSGKGAAWGWVLGLGDRHLDNVLVDATSGAMAHVDLNVLFDRGARDLKVRERVPFRLTPCLSRAFPLGEFLVGSTTGHTGQFNTAMEETLCHLAHNSQRIEALLETFLWDPTLPNDRRFGPDVRASGETFEAIRNKWQRSADWELFMRGVREVRDASASLRDAVDDADLADAAEGTETLAETEMETGESLRTRLERAKIRARKAIQECERLTAKSTENYARVSNALTKLDALGGAAPVGDEDFDGNTGNRNLAGEMRGIGETSRTLLERAQRAEAVVIEAEALALRMCARSLTTVANALITKFQSARELTSELVRVGEELDVLLSINQTKPRTDVPEETSLRQRMDAFLDEFSSEIREIAAFSVAGARLNETIKANEDIFRRPGARSMRLSKAAKRVQDALTVASAVTALVSATMRDEGGAISGARAECARLRVCLRDCANSAVEPAIRATISALPQVPRSLRALSALRRSVGNYEAVCEATTAMTSLGRLATGLRRALQLLEEIVAIGMTLFHEDDTVLGELERNNKRAEGGGEGDDERSRTAREANARVMGRLAHVKEAISRSSRKVIREELEEEDFEMGEEGTLSTLVCELVREARDERNLSKMFEGWMAWV